MTESLDTHNASSQEAAAITPSARSQIFYNIAYSVTSRLAIRQYKRQDVWDSIHFCMTLSESQRENVKSALIAAATRRSTTMRQELSAICSAPQRYRYTPEQFLVAFKNCLTEAADQSGIQHGAERDELLARLVSSFIEELFRGAAQPFELPRDQPTREPRYS